MLRASSKALPAAIVVTVIVVVLIGYFLIASRPAVKEFTLRMREFGFDGSKGGPTLRVIAGDNVKVNLKNAGGLRHDFWVVEKVEKAIEETEKGKERSFLFGARVEAVGPAEEKSISFRVDRPGSYFYVCLQPDPEIHAKLGMFGEFVVQP